MFYQQNTTKINGGKITLYKRSDLEHSSWHYRLRFEQRDIRRSTKTTDLSDAKEIANDHFHECRVKLKEGLPIFDFLLKDVANEFLAGFDQKNITSQKRKQRNAAKPSQGQLLRLNYLTCLLPRHTLRRKARGDLLNRRGNL